MVWYLKTFFVLIGIGACGFGAYKVFFADSKKAEIPVVSAPAAPVKSEPDNSEKKEDTPYVYKQMDKLSKEGEKPEELLPTQEAPLEAKKDAAPAQPEQQVSDQDNVQDNIDAIINGSDGSPKKPVEKADLKRIRIGPFISSQNAKAEWKKIISLLPHGMPKEIKIFLKSSDGKTFYIFFGGFGTEKAAKILLDYMAKKGIKGELSK